MIARAKQAFIDGRLFDEFVPVPVELKNSTAPNTADNAAELAEKYGHSDWYQFCIANWGTKWDISGDDGAIDDEDENSLSIYFDTAWSPPTAIYEKFMELGFTVSATYYEPGMAFVGSWVDGADDYYEYGNLSLEEIQEQIPEELDESYGISDSVQEWESENDESND